MNTANQKEGILMKKNFYMDLLLFVSGLVCIITGIVLDFHLFASKESTKRIMMLRELYNKYHAAGLEIYQVSLDPDEHFWKTSTAAIPWICVRDEDGIQGKSLALYNVQSIPTFFLIDRTNTLQARDAQIKDIEAAIKNLL